MAKKSNLAEKKTTEAVEEMSVQEPVASVKKQVSQKKAVASAPVTDVDSEKQLKKDKPKKIKMIRDSFTMPENDYVKLSELKNKCLQAGVHVKKASLFGRDCLVYLNSLVHLCLKRLSKWK